MKIKKKSKKKGAKRAQISALMDEESNDVSDSEEPSPVI